MLSKHKMKEIHLQKKHKMWGKMHRKHSFSGISQKDDSVYISETFQKQFQNLSVVSC